MVRQSRPLGAVCIYSTQKVLYFSGYLSRSTHNFPVIQDVRQHEGKERLENYSSDTHTQTDTHSHTYTRIHMCAHIALVQ